MIRLLFTFLLVAFLSPLAIAQTCNKDLALGKAVTTSSITAGNLPIRATDGDPTSRWESAWNNNEWIMIDLGQSYPICTINLRWQVLATAYTVEVSPDGSSWTNIVNESGNTTLNKTYSVSANGRYVRMTGLTRGSAYGFSLYDFEVIGTEPISYCSSTNVAQLRPVTVSSIANGNTGNFAVDNNMGTRWESAHSDNQYMYVDLGANYDLCRVVLNWEAAYGKDYNIDISTNGSTWATVKTVTGNYMRDNTISISGNARYVRMNGFTRGSTYGFSLWEFSVYALLPAISVTKVTDAAEPGTGGSFRFSLPTGITFTEDITVNYTTSGTALSGTDYTALSGAVVIPAGQPGVNVPLAVIDDQIIEGNETVIATITNATSPTHLGFPVSATNPSATMTISDNDNIAANKIVRINAGANSAEPSTNGAYVISLPVGITSAENITVSYTTGGTATAGADYNLPATFTLPAGQNNAVLTLTVTDDQIIENTESAVVTITGGTAATLGTFTASTGSATASLNITDDDNTSAKKIIRIATIAHAAEPSTNGRFRIYLPTGITVSEDVTINANVTGSATSGTDYVALGSVFVIPAGQNSVITPVQVIDDNNIESTETVTVTPTAASSASFGSFPIVFGATANINITDDDDVAANRRLSVTKTSDAVEGTSNGNFRISLPAGVTYPADITVNYTTGGTAVGGTDYTAIPATATIPAGQNGVDVAVTAQPYNNNIIENDKTVIMTLTGGSAPSFSAFTPDPANTTATVIIADDDSNATNKRLSVYNTGTAAEPSTNGSFQIRLPGSLTASEDITVTYTVTPSSSAGTTPATPGTDFNNLTGTVIIPAGQNAVNVPYSPIDDQIIETREEFTVQLTGGTTSALGAFGVDVATDVMAIDDNDNTPANKIFTITPTVTAAEPSTNGSFSVSLPTGYTVSQNVTFYYTVGGTATPGTDYTGIGTAVILTAGQNSVQINVPVIDDNIIEGTESIDVTPTYGESTDITGFTSSGTASNTIADDDNTASNKVISIAAANNGAEPATDAAFTISLPAGITSVTPVTVNFSVAGTATAGADYSTLATSIVIPANQNSVTLTVPVLDDQVIEGTETVIVTITGGTAPTAGTFTASATNAAATVNIADDDNTPANRVISIANANNGSEPSTNGAFTISLPTGVTLTEDVTVNFSVAGTAMPGNDYTSLGTSIVIPAGQNSVTLTVPVLDDQIIETTETVIVTITGGSATTAGTLAAGTSNAATVDITDNDNTPANKTISITTANDGSEPTSNGTFTVSLPTGVTNTEDVTVNFTVAGTATAGTDYTSLGTSVTIPAGQNSTSLIVPVLDDQLIEGTETVIVTVTGGTATTAGAFSASATNATATVNINDDDNTATNKVISIVAANDGAEPGNNAAFTISLPTGVTVNEDVTVNFTVAGTAISGTDYTAIGTSATIPAGQNSVTLTIPVLDDQLIEGTETVVVTVTGGSATNAGAFTSSASNATASVNISDDDDVAANKVISIAAANDGAEPGTDAAFTISLPAGITAAEPIMVNFTVAGTATAGTDYTALGVSTIIPAGQNGVTLTVPVQDDQIIEATETVTVTVTGGSATTAGAFTAGTSNTATVNINDNDNTTTNKVISIAAANDGTEPGTNAAFTISLPAGVTVDEDVTVNFSVAGTATSGIDYTALGTSVNIPAGQNSTTLTVPVTDDQIIEATETVIVTVTGGSATNAGAFTASATNAIATVNISDDDNTAANKVISITTANNGDEPSNNGAFTISLPTGVTVNEDVTVNFTVTGTATAGTDYTALGTSVIIPAGQNGITLTVPVLDDQIIEGTEAVTVTVTGGNATTAGAFTAGTNNVATVNINDDDNTATNKVISITAANNGTEPATNASFTISLPAGVTVNEDVTVNFTVAGTATSGVDYSAIGTSATIPAGQNSVTLTIPVLDDQIIEATETVTVTVTGGAATNAGAFTANLINAGATVNINDNDNTTTNKVISIAAANDGTEPGTNAAFTISLPAGVTADEDVTVNFSVAGTATSGIDYTALGTSVNIPAGQNSTTLTIPVTDDQIIEATETVIVTVTGGSATNAGAFTASATNAIATVNISDDDNTAANKVISITTANNGDEPSNNGAFTISLPTGVTVNEDVTVNFTVTGTAIAGTDYTALGTSVIIPAGQNSITLTVPVLDDQIIEGTEAITVTVTGGNATTAGAFTAGTNNVATVNINDDDNTTANKVISITAANDGAEPSTNGAFTISLPTGITVDEDVIVSFTVAGTATAGTDYTALATAVTIPAGQNSITLNVPVLDDQVIEATETVIVNVTGGTAATAGAFTASATNAAATINITDNDNTAANKVISITRTADGSEPSSNGAFSISLPAGISISEDLNIIYNIAGSAINGTDYSTLNGTITLPAGQNSISLPVIVNDDNIIEGAESVVVSIANATASTITGFTVSITNSSATVIIADEDNTTTNRILSINTVTDGSEPATNGRFAISLPTGITAAEDITVNYTVTGTATPGTDYTALSTSVIIPAGQNSVTLNVPVLDDQIIEATETVVVNVTGGTTISIGSFSASPTNAAATVNISDNDNTAANKVISITAANDGAEPATNGAFTISLPTGVTVSEDVTMNFTTAGTATAGADYTALSTTITIPAGQNSVTLNVPVLDDQIIESPETVIVTITGGTGATTGTFTASTTNANATINITDNDNTAANKVISITAANDGAEPSTNGAFTISLPTGITVDEAVTVNFSVAGTATEGTDYSPLGTTVTIPAGQNSVTLNVPVLDDQVIEATETVIVTVTGGSATNAGAFTASTTNTATVNISDDDNTAANKVISITTANDGAEPATDGAFTISLPTGVTVNENVTVNFSVAGTATAGADYTAFGTSVVIPAGQNSITLAVPVRDDQAIEATETVIATITGGTATNAGAFTAGTNNTATVNISDDDNTAANKIIRIVAANDGAEPATNGAFTISLPTGVTVNEDVTINFTVAGTATAGTDYTTLGTTITIPAGQNSVTLTVPVLDDQAIESPETVIVTVTAGTAATTGAFTASATNGTASININDDDNTTVNKVISIVAANDGSEPSANGAFTISLPTGVNVNEDVTVNFTVAGTATAGTDYTALGTTITIPAGQNSVTLIVPVLDDQAIESPETVTITVTGGTAATAGAFTASATNGTASININDDDNTAVNKVISIVAANDGSEPSTNGAFTISLPTGVTINEDVTVNFTVAGTATAGADYSSLGSTVIIPAGQNSATLMVAVLDDQVIESTETVIVTVTGGTGASTGTFTASTTNANATVNIGDDDNTVANRIINVSNANDGSEPATNGNFSISLPAGIVTAEDIIVNYTLAGTATAGTDYTTSGTTVTIPAGQNSVALPIVVNDDLLMEGDETVIITITGGTAATMGTYMPGTGSATLIIADDENTTANKVLSISRNADAAEPSTNGSFTVSLPAGISATENISVNYTISGTATAGTDYATLSGSVIIPAGQNSTNIDVVVNDDQLIEGNETVIATITGGTGMALGAFTVSSTNNTATVTISDDDNTAANTTISITTLNDAAEPATTGNFTISLPTGITAVEDITVSYNISGTATPGADYVALSGSIIIPAGQNSVTLPVTVTDDGLMEGTETVIVSLSGASAATLGTFTISTTNTQATVNINDDDNSVVRFETWKTAALPADNTDGKIGQGEQITYTIFIRNTGNVNIPSLSVQDPVPAYTSYISGGALIGNNVHFSIVDLQPNAVSQVSFVVQTYDNLNGVQHITNVAQISDGTTTLNTVACDPSDPNCNGGNQTIVPVRELQGDLVISKQAVTQPTSGQYYALGENITYEIRVSNVGEKTFTNIAITDSLPASLDMPSYYISSKGSIIASPAAKKVITSVDQLLPGEEVTITITCRVNNKEIVNTAYVQADETETDLSNNTAVATAAASIKDLAFINAFRPGNGANNRFVIVGLEKYPGSKLLVYSRWGSLVYQSNDYKNDWKALDLPMGSYIYVAEVKKPEGVVIYKGDFIIIR